MTDSPDWIDARPSGKGPDFTRARGNDCESQAESRSGFSSADRQSARPDPRPDDTKRPSKDDYRKQLDDADKQAAGDAMEEALNEYVQVMLDRRKVLSINNADLTTRRAQELSNIPQQIRQQARDLHEHMRYIITKAAENVEARRYQNAGQAIQDMDLGFNEQQRAHALVRTDRKFNTSCQTVRVCMELFGEINNRVLRKLDDAVIRGDGKVEKQMLLGNAVMVYELADFLAKFIETFRVQGADEFHKIHGDMKSFSSEIRSEISALRKKAANKDVNETVRERVLKNADNREKAVCEMDREWDILMSDITKAQQQVAVVGRHLPTIQLIKDDADNQLKVLQALEIVNIIKGSLGAIDAAKLALDGIALADMGEQRIRRLLGIQ